MGNSITRNPTPRSIREQWQASITSLRAARASHDQWRLTWNEAMSDWDRDRWGPLPMWFPTNNDPPLGIGRMMTASGHADFDPFYDWSIAQPAEFCRLAIEQLGIVFSEAPITTLDATDPINPRWLDGARYNIVASCFQADEADTAIVQGDVAGNLQSVTYGELRKRVARVVRGLQAAGWGAGNRIAIVMPMNVESVAIYLGIIATGAVAVSIADSFAAEEIERRLRIARADAVFTCGDVTRAGKSLNLYSRVVNASAPTTIVVGPCSMALRTRDTDYQGFLDAADALPTVTDQWDAGPPDRMTGILFSSGTTGEPKAIPWDQTTPIKCALDGCLLQDIRHGDVVTWPTNLGWMMGPWLIYASLINRATIGLFDDAPVGQPFGRFVQDAKVTMLGVVPTMVRQWRASASMEAFNWSAIRCFSSTGEVSNPADMFYLASLAGMKPVIEYCGGTEIGGGYISSTMLHPNVPGAFSTPVPGTRFTLLDSNNQPADEGTLYLIPPALGLSTRLVNGDHHQVYYADTPPGPHAAALRRHGDYFRRTTGGYYFAGGRVDDTMNLGGIKVSSAEIEKVLSELLIVSESAAVAVPDDQAGPEQLVVYVVPEKNVGVTDNDFLEPMNRLLKSRLNPLFKVHAVRIVDSLPRTASNKVMRRELRRRFIEETPK